MRKETKILRAMGLVAPIALTIALAAAPAAFAADEENLWSAPENTAWVNSAGECWQSEDGPTNLPPCAVVPETVTVHLNFEFDKYQVPETVVNKEEISKIDDYIAKVKATPQKEYVTLVGHTDAKGSEAYNYELGMRRADAVRNYIIAQGYPADQVAPAESRGKLDMLPGVSPYSVEQRRVEITKTDM